MTQSQVWPGPQGYDPITLVAIIDSFGLDCSSVRLSPTISSLGTNHFLREGRGGGIEEGHKQGEGQLSTARAQIGGIRQCPVVL